MITSQTKEPRSKCLISSSNDKTERHTKKESKTIRFGKNRDSTTLLKKLKRFLIIRIKCSNLDSSMKIIKLCQETSFTTRTNTFVTKFHKLTKVARNSFKTKDKAFSNKRLSTKVGIRIRFRNISKRLSS